MDTEIALLDSFEAYQRGEIPLSDTAGPLYRHIETLVESGEMFDIMKIGLSAMGDKPLRMSHTEDRSPSSVDKFNAESREQHGLAKVLSRKMAELKMIRRARDNETHGWLSGWVITNQVAH